MTGYGQADGAIGPYAWTWNIHSNNHQHLARRVSLPQRFHHLEKTIRTRLAQHVTRGDCRATLHLDTTNPSSAIIVDKKKLGQVIEAARKIHTIVGGEMPSVESLLATKGILKAVSHPEKIDEPLFEQLEQQFLATFDHALKDFLSSRAEEGARLASLVTQYLTEIDDLLRLFADIQKDAAADTIDIEEELQRLRIHADKAWTTMREHKPSRGRKLAFIAREMSREATTLAAKARHPAIAQHTAHLSLAIDRIAEQANNLQ